MIRFSLVLLGLLAGSAHAAAPANGAATDGEKADGDGAASERAPACIAMDNFFADQVWAKVGERTCLKCHHAAGDAAESALVLSDPVGQADRAAEILAGNRDAMARLARTAEGDQSRMLVKVTGGLDHGGGAVLSADTPEYAILERFTHRARGLAEPRTEEMAIAEARDATPMFEGVQMLSPQRLLRRVTLSLAGRLPSAAERAEVDQEGMDAIHPILDRVLQEDAFFYRLAEGFNDLFLTRGYDGVPENVLSYDHFEKTRHWYQQHDLSEVPEEMRQKARYKLADDYREAMLREPLELIKHIVRNERPFTELVTADYILVSPYTSRGYGLYEDLREEFADPDDPYEFIVTRLPALTGRNGDVQPSDDGFYPHSGLLSLFHYLRRYPTTDTNRNRLRSRMVYQHFLGVDIMQLAPRTTDASAVGAQFEIPTMQAPDCVVCHRTLDPLAGLYQNYNDEGYYAPPREGWYSDMFVPGFEGEDLPEEARSRPAQWLGQRIAGDPRFATAMVGHVYYILTGRALLQPPQDIEHPHFSDQRRAYQHQRQMVEAVAEEFRHSGFNLKVAFKELIATPFYRADGLAAGTADPARLIQLADVGVVRMLTPEQLERKLEALFGQRWGRLDGELQILYGGIDSSSVTERMTDPSGAMGAIQRIMANDVACKYVPQDFTTEPSQRRLFPGIEPGVLPSSGPEAEAQIRRAIVHLHQYLLGREHATDDPEVDRTYALFTGIIDDASVQEGLDTRESYFCRGCDDQRLDDPHYTLRAWRGVVTYLLRQHDFLYE